MLRVGGFQPNVTALSLGSPAETTGGSAILAAGSTSKKFENAAPCPAELTYLMEYLKRVGWPASSNVST
jgi:hypothetical protein